MAKPKSHLEMAERHVREGEQRIAEMRARLDQLEAHGYANAADLARDLLKTLVQTQRLAEDHLAMERRLGHLWKPI